MNMLPPLDLHAHIDTDIPSADLHALGAVVFAPTRTLDEAEVALARRDPWTIWGVGTHPGLVKAHKGFTHERFARLCQGTPYVSEIGLDGKSRVTMPMQQSTFTSTLEILQTNPRITSIHSYAATGPVLKSLSRFPLQGGVLHWWLGSEEETQQAITLGCYFSINSAMARRTASLRHFPLNRVIPETDHPFGDRSSRPDRRPGAVGDVEQALAKVHGVSAAEVRQQTWMNLAELVRTTQTRMLLPRPVRVLLATLPVHE